jgi:hypothetical protein
LNVGRQWNDDGLVFGAWVGGGGSATYTNFWQTYINGGHDFERADDLDTRGGPPILRLASDWFNIGVNSDSRKSWNVSVNGSGGHSRAGDWNASFGANLRVRASARLQTSVSANYTSAEDIAQWISNEDADGDGATDHVYGRLRRDVLNITGRATFAFTRDMTLEAFLQPFVAVGDYTDIKKLARPRSFDFSPVSLADNPDFNRKSLRGTMVLRWEYSRGSTLFVVWNMSASDDTRPGVFSPLHDLGGAFAAPGTNVVAVKISYWFTP